MMLCCELTSGVDSMPPHRQWIKKLTQIGRQNVPLTRTPGSTVWLVFGDVSRNTVAGLSTLSEDILEHIPEYWLAFRTCLPWMLMSKVVDQLCGLTCGTS